MNKKIAVLAAAFAAVSMMPSVTDAAAVTANVPVGSVYYTYLDKLNGMGYIDDLPNGAKPYSRMQMAKWVMQAEANAKLRPMPAYLKDQLRELEHYVAPEIEVLKGKADQDNLAMRDMSLELTNYNSDKSEYDYARPHTASWQPFQGKNGYHYADGFNAVLKGTFSGNVGHETALSITPRVSWNDDDDTELKLEEGYVKTRTGVFEWEAGREALTWGQGKTGTFTVSNTVKPLTAVQVHLQDDRPMHGFFRFLGKQNYHAFYAQLEDDRSDVAKRTHSGTDYDDAGLLGLRADYTPTDYFTFGLARVSMLGGDGSHLSGSDWGKWLVAKNSGREKDRWDDIAGGDFRFRLPGVQFYGEVYGEDAGGLTPTERAYRFGVYLPQLTRDGSWDMTAEYASTNNYWYVHQRYNNGWTYSGDIIGDNMGNNARKYYVDVNHYMPGNVTLGAYFQRTEYTRDVLNNPTVNEAAVHGSAKVSDNMFLNASLGVAKINSADFTSRGDRDVFATAGLQWQY